MASTIIIKNGAGGSTPSSLKQGELAINVDNGKLFYGTSGSSNAVSSSFSFQHITASGEISASKVIADTISGGVGQNGLTLIGDITSSGIIDASPSKIVLGDLAANIAGRTITLDQTQTGALQFNMQTGAHIVASTDRFEITDTPGNLSTQLDVKGEITASGNISSSGTGSFNHFFVSGEISGSVSASGTGSFTGGVDAMDATGSFGYISASTDISASGIVYGSQGRFPSRVITDLVLVGANIGHDGDTTTKIEFADSGGAIDFLTEGSSRIDLNNQGVRLGGANSRVTTILDEDNLASDSDTSLATQQSIKAYVDANAGGVSGNTFATDLKVGRDADNLLDFTTDNQVTFRVSANDGVVMKASGEIEATSLDVSGDISSSATLLGRALTLATNGVNALTIATDGALSASSTLAGTALTLGDDGINSLTVDTKGHISASGTGSFRALNITDDGVAKFNVDTNGHVSASGFISSSSGLKGRNLILATNGIQKASIDTSGNIAAEGTISSSGLLSGTSLDIRTAGVQKAAIDANGTGSFLGGIDAGANSATGSFGYISASGDITCSGKITVSELVGHGSDTILASDGKISASNALLGNSAQFAHNGTNTLEIDTSGNLSTTGRISASAALMGNSAQFANNGVNTLNISSGGAISASSTIQGTAFTAQTNGTTKATIDASGNADFEGNLDVNGTTNLDDVDIDGNVDLDGNLTIGENSSGHVFQVFGNSTGVNMAFNVSNNDMLKLGDNTILGVGGGNSAGTSDLEIVHDGTDTIMNNKTGRLVVTSSNAFDIQASDTSFSGDVSGSGTGSFVSLNIKDQGVLKASIDANGVVTGSVFHGTQHILYSGTIYINDDPLVQNSLYMGNSVGNQDSNWNDPQAAGGTLGSTSTVSISEDDTRWGMILPFDVSKVEIQCSVRPGGACSGDNFFVGLYTAARPNNSADANYNITLVAHNDSTFQQGKYTTNDFTHTANLDKGSLIFVGIGSEDATAAKNAPGILNVIITQR